MDRLLAMYAGEKNIKVDLTDLIVKSFMEPRDTLVIPRFLTKVFDHFGIEIFSEDKHVCKEAFTKTTCERMFFPKNPSI